MEPLDLTAVEPLDDLVKYTEGIPEQMRSILAAPATEHRREQVDTIVIPVRVKGAWSLYCTQNSVHTQSLMTVATNFRACD